MYEMALLPIIKAPDPILKKVCAPVEQVDDDIRSLMDDMLETIYAAPGVGLAAPQVGVQKRVIVVDTAGNAGADAPRAPVQMANPELIDVSEEKIINEEGCLSFPDQYAEVMRPARIRVRYLDHDNEIRELDADGMRAVCIQHEMDHLDGVLFVDYLSALKRKIILRKMSKLRKSEATPPKSPASSPRPRRPGARARAGAGADGGPSAGRARMPGKGDR
jgi:peptide deformylase